MSHSPAKTAPATRNDEQSNRFQHWRINFTTQSVTRSAHENEGAPSIELSFPDGERRLFTTGSSRHEILAGVHGAESAHIVLPDPVRVPDSAVHGGEFGLRAWTMATVATALRPKGPVDAVYGGSESLQSVSASSVESLSTEHIREMATNAVAAFSVIRDAMSTVSGADAVAVESFTPGALREAAAVYAFGGERRRLLNDVLTFAGAGFDFPWDHVRGDAESLAILYNFAPFQDTGSTVASKRLRVFAENFDVISCSFLQHKKQDQTVESISRPYVASKEFLPLTPSWASWSPFRAFAERAARSAHIRMLNGADYGRLYTRAMWAPSLYAGMRIKLDYPELPWTAEFSDPLSLDVEGAARGGAVPRDEFTEPLIEQWESDFGPLDESDLTIFRFAELLVFAYADTIIFTNEHQRSIMLETIDRPTLSERVVAHSTVAHHPTLDPGFYELETVDYSVDDDHVHLGYFGEFYTARGITEITDALRSLPEHVSSRIRLHVFTNYIPEEAGGVKPASFSRKQFDLLVKRTLEGVGVSGVEDLVVFNNSLPYLRFLAVSETLDFLIVTDARSGAGHSVNPYLPSKWSDYLGSKAKVWALAEEGSVLSGMDLDARTPIGDAHAARSVLWNMVDEKFGRRTMSAAVPNRNAISGGAES